MKDNRRLYTGKNGWDGFEYLAVEMEKMKVVKDPSWSIEMGNPSYVDAKKRAQ